MATADGLHVKAKTPTAHDFTQACQVRLDGLLQFSKNYLTEVR
jgi:hypothetical protein